MLDQRKGKTTCDVCDFKVSQQSTSWSSENKCKHFTTRYDKSYDSCNAINTCKVIGRYCKRGKKNDNLSLVTKSKLPPFWAGQSFEQFDNEVKDCDKHNQENSNVKLFR